MPRPRRVRIHFIVSNLKIPRAWRVGGATLYPPGRLHSELARAIAGLPSDRWPPNLKDDWLKELTDKEWATIAVPVVVADPGRPTDAEIQTARNHARDVVAVLRVFQSSQTVWNIDSQTFGLGVDIGSVLESRWVTTPDWQPTARAWEVHGIMAEWTILAKDIRTFQADPRFTYLESAVASRSRSEWQRRVVVAARTRNLATVMQRPATRIVLLATALEALLGNEYCRRRLKTEHFSPVET